MAVRMNVLVLRPPGNGSKAHHQFDDVIGQLLGRPGLDVTLLERLPGPDDSTTERLALESLGGHIACLAWADANAMTIELAAAGKPMSRRPHQHDADAASTNGAASGSAGGRMFYFDMRRPGANVSIFDDLQELLRTLQTPMFRIGSEPKLLKTKPNTQPTTALGAPVRPESAPRAAAPPAAPIALPRPAPERVAEDSEDDLDRLVDELDDLDL